VVEEEAEEEREEVCDRENWTSTPMVRVVAIWRLMILRAMMKVNDAAARIENPLRKETDLEKSK
jgi:hypothetical protein